MKVTIKRNVTRFWSVGARVGMGMLAALLGLMLGTPVSAQGVSIFHRGVAIHDAMNWATMDAAKKRYVFPPFSDAGHPLTQGELAIIRKAGFDFVRLTIDPGPFLQFQGAQRDATYAILRRRVQTILAADLSVIVDFHPVGQDEDYGPKAIVQGIDTPLFHSYCDMLAHTARVLAGLDTNRVALELMNEPDIGYSQVAYASWQAMLEKAYGAARSGAPHLTLVLAGPAARGVVDGLTIMNPKPFAQDQAVTYTFHYYAPYEFTMQSLPSDTVRGLEIDVPYPTDARPISDSMNALSAKLDQQHVSTMERAEDTARIFADITAYRLKGFNRATIHSDFDRVTAWAKANNIPPSRIFMGEFGVIRRYGRYDGARDSERAEWLKDVREEAEAHGFFWSIWAYRGSGGMAIVKNDATDEIDPVTVRALGIYAH